MRLVAVQPLPVSPSGSPLPPDLFEDITDLMAEALFQDFQAHRKATVKSPKGIDHTKSLTKKGSENNRGIMLRIAVDTVAINRIADSPHILEELQEAARNSKLILVSNHVVRDQLSATPNPERRNRLLSVYASLPINEVMTSGGIWGISVWGESTYGDSSITGLSIDDARTGGRGGGHDALIGITAADNADVLVTDDEELSKKLKKKKSACAVWSFTELCNFLRQPDTKNETGHE